MLPLMRPDPAASPEYYLLADGTGNASIPYLFEATQGAGGATGQCEVIVKAREAGFARYIVTPEKVALSRGDTPAGPWQKVCEHRYVLQWQDRRGAWRTVAPEKLTDLTLAAAEFREHVEVRLTGKVARPEGFFALTSRYGVDLEQRDFLAEDRFVCDGLTSDGEARPMRLVQTVVLDQDHPDLAEPEEEPDAASATAGSFEKRMGSLKVGWRRHTRRTGDQPGLRVDKPAKELSVTYHEEGVTGGLDVDPHVVVDDSNTNFIGSERCIGRSAAGETAIIFCDDTTPRVRLAYTTAQPPTQTADWSFVTLAGSSGVITSDCTGGFGIFRASLCLDERSGWLHVLWNDGSHYLAYSKCDISGGISAVTTSSNWVKADGTQGFDELGWHYNNARYKILVDADSEARPFITFNGSNGTGAGRVGFRKWDGSQWTSVIPLLTSSVYAAGYSSTIDDEDVIWVFGNQWDGTPDYVREAHCDFDDAHDADKWSSEVTVILDETYDAKHVSCCCDGSGTPYVFGGTWYSSPSPLGWFNWYDGSSWTQGTGSGSGLEKSLPSSCCYACASGADAAGNAFFIYSSVWAAYQRNSSDTFATGNGSYGGDPADYVSYSFEQRQLSSDDKLYGVGAEGGDIYFQYLTTASGSPWWKAAVVAAGGGGTYFTNNHRQPGDEARPRGASCRFDPRQNPNAKDQTGAAVASMVARLQRGISSDVTTEYPAGNCPWDGEDKCNTTTVVPY